MDKQTKTQEEQNLLRQPCQVYTRVMGYLRPVSRYNVGKKSEFYDRKYFTEAKSLCRSNRQFINKYGEDTP